jgi:methyl-CpG-binding domain protein 4
MKKTVPPPMSPYRYRQEAYREDPWKMLIVCMMLNQTSYKQVDRVKDLFFERFPGPEDLVNAPDEEIVSIIRPLGFYNRRARTWKRFSSEWICGSWKSIDELPGVGKYASDSWKIFQEHVFDITVEDKELKKYLHWVREAGHDK